jgi:hypothetical protein
MRKVQWDYRLGGIPRLVIASDEELMQIPDEIRKCVAFLACKRNSGYKIGGTVFFVGCPFVDIEGSLVTYAVTAKHNIEEIKEHGNDGNVYCRLNSQQKGIQFAQIPIASWVFNDDERIDVAIAQMSLDFKLWDHKCLPMNMFLNREIILSENIGIGDDLFFPGLFTQRPGEMTNLPIIRIGNIAAMPEEPIDTKWGLLPSGYLVEARSIGGLSGSPVFWCSGSTRTLKNVTRMGREIKYYLLGLVHGHYNIKEEAWDFNDETSTDNTETRSLNMGIAIVIPASDILDTLNNSDLQKEREILRQGILAEKRLKLPVPDAMAESPIEIIIQEDVIVRTKSKLDMSNYFSVDTMNVQPENEEPPMNP